MVVVVGIHTSLVQLNLTIPQLSSPSSRGHIWYAAPVAILMFASIFYSISSSRNRKKEDNTDVHNHASSSSRKSNDEQIYCDCLTDCGYDLQGERTLEDDAKYAEELQVQETLLACMLPDSHKTFSTSLRSLLKDEAEEECKICLEKRGHWQMFTNPTCCHSFCYGCTTKHATTKMQEKNKTISCPGINCKSTLDSDALRPIISKRTLIEWDEFLCESMIPISHRLYCPFTNCSVLLVNDHDTTITKIDCPACRRSFCAVCRVPWHSEFSCKEYGKLVSKKGKKEDDIAVALAKKKKWRKCPNCHFFVEKTEGCVHITCRCEYEFCYNCGAKWSGTHGGCRPR